MKKSIMSLYRQKANAQIHQNTWWIKECINWSNSVFLCIMSSKCWFQKIQSYSWIQKYSIGIIINGKWNLYAHSIYVCLYLSVRPIFTKIWFFAIYTNSISLAMFVFVHYRLGLVVVVCILVRIWIHTGSKFRCTWEQNMCEKMFCCFTVQSYHWKLEIFSRLN